MTKLPRMGARLEMWLRITCYDDVKCATEATPQLGTQVPKVSCGRT